MMDKSIRTLSDKMRVQFFSTQTILPQIQYDFVATKTMPHMTQILYTTSQGTVVFCLVLFCFALHISLFFVKKECTKVLSSSKISLETNNTQFFYYEKVKILITFCFHSPYLYIFWLSSSIYHLLLQLLDRSAAIFTF